MFYTSWWLDIVCGSDQWDVCLHTRDGNKVVQGALPYFYQKKFGFLLLRQPFLTPYLGPIYNYPANLEKRAKKYAFEKRVTKELISKLPNYSYFNQHCNTQVTNGQPFHWGGFTQVNQYTYQIDLIQPIEVIQKSYETNVRNEIKRAVEKGLEMREVTEVHDFIKINQKTFQRQGREMPYSPEMIEDLDGALQTRKLRTIYGAYDPEGNIHAAIYLLKENKTLYTLMIGTDAAYRNSGAVQFLVNEIIVKYKDTYHRLDFCGSMIENIERVFRSFGAEQVPYLRVYHQRSKAFKLISALRGRS